MQELFLAIEKLIATTLGESFTVQSIDRVRSGCINRCYRVADADLTFFVKTNDPAKLNNLKAEYLGLQQLASAGSLRVPKPLAVGLMAGQSVLVLEYLALEGTASDSDWYQMGLQLASLHQVDIARINASLREQQAPQEALLPEVGFGVRLNNATLGDSPGFLGEHSDWASFFCEYRLKFQFQQAQLRHATLFSQQQEVLQVAYQLLSHQPNPSLVHGDLWHGNLDFFRLDATVVPLVFDPAPYIADAEVDLAMSELFGGFPEAFYSGYRSIHPVDEGYPLRRDLYNLYQILNHYNLFQGHYLQQSEAMIAKLCEHY